MMTDAMGLTLDRLTFDVISPPRTRTPISVHADPQGQHRRRVRLPPRLGRRQERRLRRVQLDHGRHVTPPKKIEHGHVIQVFGRPNFRTVINCLPPTDWDEDGYMGPGMIYTAMPATNAIPRRRGRPGHRDAQGSATGHRPRGGLAGIDLNFSSGCTVAV